MMRAPPVLPAYQILAPLAEGGMGQVYLARKEDSDVLSVIKTITEHKAEDEDARRRFLREVAVTSRLDHPNIAKHLDSGEEGDLVYLVLEYLTGKDLWSIFKAIWTSRRSIPPEFALTIGIKILDALAYAHALTDDDGHPLGLVHRDLSPKNVMVTFQGDAKIIDFGLARFDDDSMKTKTGTVLGTLRYLSPEQLTGQKADRRADLYTWAVVLYEALTSERLVKDTTREALTKAILVDDPAPISTKNRELPKALDDVFATALTKDPEKRYGDAKSFAAALEAAAPALVEAPSERIGQWMTKLFVSDYRQSLALLRLAETVAPGSAKKLAAKGAPGHGLQAEAQLPSKKPSTMLVLLASALLVVLSALGGVATYFVRHGDALRSQPALPNAPLEAASAGAPGDAPPTVSKAPSTLDQEPAASLVHAEPAREERALEEARAREEPIRTPETRRPTRTKRKGPKFFSPGGTLDLSAHSDSKMKGSEASSP